MERICVAIRVKPSSKQELSNGNQWKVVDNTISLFSPIGTPIKGQTYSFDTVFGTGARNADIYDEHAKDVVLSAVSGFNGTVFAYGQTSSGKTYTMQGSGADPGVTRLAIRDVFTNIEKIANREFLIRVSYMEIYNEEINDLLAPENRKLRIHENLERGIFVAGLREEIVNSVEQVIAVLERGEAQRHFGETNMNVNSSRSHTIFRMVIESRDKSHDSHQESDPTVQDAVRVSALNMVDLAGSERISKTGAGGARLKEGAHINKSLTTLGIVINKLSDGGGKQGAHVPYRDSKLTRILQSALGGNAKTAIICTINPDEIHIDETRGTLQFASRAKRVTNCAQVNEILTDAALLKRQTREIEDLRRRLQGSPHSEDLEKEILHLRNDLLKFELERERLELELQEEKKAQVERERRIKEQEQRIENLSTMVISGAMEDRELPSKKSNRRETWCPRKVHSDVGDQGFRKVTPEKDDFSFAGSLDNSLQPLASRRDRTFGLPPAFESLVDDESDTFWSNSSGVENSPALSEFGNIADEDTWASLNKDPAAFANVADEDTWASLNEGHVDVDGRFSANSLLDNGIRQASRQAQSSAVAEEGSKITMLEEQVRDLKLQYKELQTSIEQKIQQETRGVVEAANKSMQQLKSVLEEKSKLEEALARHNLSKRPTRSNFIDEALYKKKQEDKVKNLESELEKCKQENISLQVETEKLRDQLLHTKTALEQGVQERVSMDEENKFFRQRLHSLEMGIQDDFHQSSDRTVYVGGDMLEPTHLCSLCCSSREKNVGESSMEGEAVDQVSPTRYSLTYPEVPEKFEIPPANVHKRRLFEDTEENYKDQSLKGSDSILAAMNCLCCRIKQLGGSAATMDFNKKEQSKNLKLSLTLANRLATQLLEELHSIVNHDFRCLDSHVSANGPVGQTLEALQVLLLESADAALCLFYKTWSKEPSVTSEKLQELLHEVIRVGAQKTEVNLGAYKHKGGQEANPVDGKEVELEGGGKNAPIFLSKHGKVSGAVNEEIKNPNIENGPSDKINLLATEEGAGFSETLKMSGQHISTLDYEPAIQSLEKEKLSKVLLEQLNVNQESIKAMKAEKLQLARDLESYMGALAMHDEVVAAICDEIKEFEKEIATKRDAPIQAALNEEVYQQLQKQETSNLTERYVYYHSTQEVEQDLQQMLGQNIRACTHSNQHLLLKSPSMLERDNLILETALSATREKLKAAEEDIVQLRRDVEESLCGTHTFPGPLSTSIALSDPWCRDHFVDAQYVDQVGERLSLDEDTMLITEDIEEDICNFDLQPDNELELGLEVNGLSQSSLYLEMVDWDKGAEHDVVIRGVQNDGTREEQSMMSMMSEAEKQFTMALLRQVKVLEARLAVAEMEVVEYKVEMEHLQVNNMQATMETPLAGDEELQLLRAECEVQKDEIRLLMEQVLTPEAELEQDLLFQETNDRNYFLENCLKKAERRLIRAKGWREELLKLRKAEELRESLLLETQARIATLEEEGATLRKALSQVQPLQHLMFEESGSTTGGAKPELLANIQDSELQLSFDGGLVKQDGVTTPSGKCFTQPSPSTPSSHARGLCPRPTRPVLGEVNRNSLKSMHPNLLTDPNKSKCYQQEVAKGTALDLSNKENQSGFMNLFHGIK